MSKRTSAKRVADSKVIALWSKLKNPVKSVWKLTQKEEDFVSLFRYCFPNLWKNIDEFHSDMFMWNESRIKKKLSPIYCFGSAAEFLMCKAGEYKENAKLQTNVYKDAENRSSHIEALHVDSLTKLEKSTDKENNRERLKQHVTPSYVDVHIKLYNQWRKYNSYDINTRYLIIHELAKYKCQDTIKFLESLVRCEKNLSLQHYAWECLNSLGVTGVHKGRRPGKKKPSHLKPYKELNSPKELLGAIYNSPLEKMKHYDLFLSHSYKDKSKLIKIKEELNALGINVYIDWVNDKDELVRSNTSKETASVIAERMKSCSAIMYIHSESCLASQWTPWELGFAYAKGIPIFVYRPESCINEPEYLQLYNVVEYANGDYYVQENGAQLHFKDWLAVHEKYF